MDPNIRLNNLRRCIAALESIINDPEDQMWKIQTSETIEIVVVMFKTLDEWLRKGGELPSDWNVRRGPKKAPP